MRAVTTLARRRVECVSDLTIDRWLLGETPGSDEARRLEEHMKGCTGCASRIGALRGLYSTQPVPALQQPPVHLVQPPEATPSQTGAVQFLILRDGLLVGTEFFTPGSYAIGSDPRADLQLDGVAPLHARIYFRDGKVALKAEGAPVWVSGFKIDSCEVRSIDEVLVGPYVLRVRVIRERWSDVHVKEAVTELTVVDAVVDASLALPAPVKSATERGAGERAAIGSTRLTAELWWGDTRQAAAGFEREITAKDFTMWGFDVPASFVLARPRAEGGFTVHTPGGSDVTLTLGQSHSVDMGALKLTWRVDEVLPVLPRAKFEGWAVTLLAAAMMTVLFGGFALAPEPEEEPFEPKTLHAFVKLIPPPPKPVKVARAEQPAERSNTPKDVKRPVDRPPRATRPPPASQPADPLASVMRMLGGGSFTKMLESTKNARTSGGKSKNLFAGLALPGTGKTGPSLGIGPSTGTGIGVNGLKKSGVMGLGRTGLGKVGGTVDPPTGSSVGLRGPPSSIDKDALAKVINSHLNEVSACYERSLIKSGDTGGGKLTVEWTVTTSGDVATAKVKSSSLKDGGVATCVLSALKRWRFPAAKGGSVVVSYPFIFHTTGF